MKSPSWYRTIENQVYNMIARAITSKIEESGLQFGSISVGIEEDFREVERVQNYGFTGFPGPDGESVVLFPTGSREFPILISVDHPQIRKKLKEWESALYTKFGSYVHLKNDGSIEINSPEKIDVKTPKGNLDFGSELNIKSTKTVLQSNKFAVKSDSDELIKLLSEVLDALLKISAVAQGPTSPVNFVAFIALITPLKTRLQKFMV